jgi:hypothetical protein
MNEMTEERAGELIRTKGKFNKRRHQYESKGRTVASWVGRTSHAWTFRLTEANNYLSPQKSQIAFKVQL